MKRCAILLLLLFAALAAGAQPFYRKSVAPVRNVIVMIPDGTSTSVLSAARWYKFYNDPSQRTLNLDSCLCGLVGTFSSDSPIPCSAPAMSGYMTGIPQQAGNISVYPASNPAQDIVEVDPGRAYQPLAPLLEAAKYDRGKATGLVVTVDFCHATPAACASHYYSRHAYSVLAAQMAANDLDVVFGGGRKQVTDAMREYLRGSGTTLIEQDAAAFRAYDGKGPVWSLFARGNMNYDLDRDDAEQPSLAEMTAKALDVLAKHENGFFLMVEGSRVDMAAHAKDPVGVITEMLAFDKAGGVALDFARRDGQTAVVIMPDHGTSGLSFGDASYKDYTSKGLDSAYLNISKVRRTASGLEKILLKAQPEQIRPLFREYTGIELTDGEVALLQSSRNYTEADYMKVANSVNMVSSIARIVTSRTHFGFLSGSHTAEDVFLAVYHPAGDLPVGRNTNTEINAYMADLLGLQRPLEELTGELFAPHTEVFRGAECSISAGEGQTPCLTVRKGRRTLRVPAFGSVAYLDGKPLKLGSVAVYIDRNDTFYLPRELGEKL
ncbi:MAG: alkaline phosphatase [Alistipes sp.]|nr:alkaline phosphatase [Alistipes sp.]